MSSILIVLLIGGVSHIFFESRFATIATIAVGLIVVLVMNDLVPAQFIGEGGAKWLKP